MTEPLKGSETINVDSTPSKVEGGYLLNGEKFWIGNGTEADFVIIWAKNLNDGGKI